MNEPQFGNRIRQLLNQGLTLDRGIADRLRAARDQALDRQRGELTPVLAWADDILGSYGGWRGWACCPPARKSDWCATTAECAAPPNCCV